MAQMPPDPVPATDQWPVSGLNLEDCWAACRRGLGLSMQAPGFGALVYIATQHLRKIIEGGGCSCKGVVECVLQQGRVQQYCAEFPKGCELVTVHAAVLTECVRPCLCLGERFAQLVHRKGIPAMSLRHLLKEDSRDLSHLRT